jgi:hypothetical protein
MSLLGSKSAKKKKGEAEPAAEKPAKAAKPAKAPKAPKPARGVVLEKPKSNIYTVLLGLALTALLVGIVCLYAELNAYEWKMK